MPFASLPRFHALGTLVAVLSVILSGFHLLTAYAGTYYPYTQRAFPIMIAVALVLLTVRAVKVGGELSGQGDGAQALGNIPWYDWLLVVLSFPVFGYVAFYPDYLSARWALSISDAPTALEQAIAVAGLFLLLEATRRLTGWVLVIGAVIALLYVYLGEYVPVDDLAHRGFTFLHIVDYMYLTLDGVWGVAMGVAATYIVVFIIFGAFMEKAGSAEFFVELVTAIAGHTRGGPGKVGVFSSALVGSVTGSSVANVYTTGQVTIPMMIRLGYRPPVAAAIEALASNGGQIMPPVLGAAAFIVAAYSGVSYQTIILASILPAFLYFLSLLWFIHLESVRTGMKGMPIEEKPRIIDVLRRRGHLLIPMITLIGLLVTGISPLRAAFFSVCVVIVVSWLRPETRLTPRQLLEAAQLGAKNSLMILCTCAVVGIIIGTFTMTGLAVNASSAIISFSGGIYIFVLISVVVASLLLGMGMNTVAAFMLVSVLGVPALREVGVDNLTAHMFVFYAALLSHITPPVCLAVFAAAQIANANIWTTAFTAMKMGLVAYLMPFLIAGSPSLLLGTAGEFDGWSVAAAFSGSLLAALVVEGWFYGRQWIVERCVYGLAAVLLIVPIADWRLLGPAVAVAGVAFSLARTRGAIFNAVRG